MKHEKYSLGYDLLRIYAGWLHRMIHRRITVIGRENIPRDKPLIFTPNHQNALMDAMAVLLLTKHQPTWLARADIFKNKTIGRILYFLKISPVYRIRDGKDNLGKNDEVFELSIRVLKNHKALALFPEAQHTFKRQSAAHKKAVPRIAFMAEEREDFTMDIHIIPIGIYYDHYYNFNRELIVTFGEPVRVKTFENQYRENPGAANIALRKEIYAKLVPLTLHIKSKEHYEEYETLREIYINSFCNGLKSAEKLDKEKNFIKKTEAWVDESTDELLEDASKYKTLLQELRIEDRAASKKPSFFKGLANAFAAGFTLPIFLYGWLNFFMGFHLPSILIRKKIKDRVFWATVEYVAWMIFIPIFTLIQWGLVWIFTGNFLVSMVYLLTLPAFGKIALYLNDYYTSLMQQFLMLKKPSASKKISQLRQEIMKKISQFH